MIYLAAVAAIILIAGIYRRVKRSSGWHALLDAVAAIVSGWVAGLLLGVGARIGMWAIPFFNGTESRFSLDGSLQVVLTFSLLGIGLGLLYEFVFRRLFHESGHLYGLAISLVTVYPLGGQGVQQLNFSPSLAPLAFFTFLSMALMFLPYALALEFILTRWHRRHDPSTLRLQPR